MDKSTAPLAERMRPNSLDEFIGQAHLVDENGILRKVIESANIPSMVFWGPPGVGKTTLAHIISEQLEVPFYSLSAVDSGVKQVRHVIELAEKQPNTILFIDEIHRFNKSQQDALLKAVEKGTIRLIGATTENPSFEVISPLLSRCQVYLLKSLSKDDLTSLLQLALKKDPFLKKKKIKLKETDAILRLSGGDARKLYNLLELTVEAANSDTIEITDEIVMKWAQQRLASYDKKGEQHYDIISAFIKSIRGSDPNAGLYWLARMIEGGEDPKFIARRLLILASEDIGNANPTALVLATSCFQAVTMIGYPECELILAHTTTYLATSAKSNSAIMGILAAKKSVKDGGDLPIPLHLRNAPTSLMKELNYGKDYNYPHSHTENFVQEEYLPDQLSGYIFYDPGDNQREKEMREKLKKLWGKKYGY